jgi:hypothetical protein
MNKLCKQCPFRKDSIAGWLGEASHQPEEFLATIENSPIACHMTVDWEEDDRRIDEEIENAPACLGSLQFHKNSCKQPKDRQYANLVEVVDKNEEVFNWRHEFIKHHSETKI